MPLSDDQLAAHDARERACMRSLGLSPTGNGVTNALGAVVGVLLAAGLPFAAGWVWAALWGMWRW